MLTSMTAILCADDDVFFLYSIWKALRADGFRVLTAGNATIALEVSRKHHGPIDLLLTCIDLPRMSGLELSGIIKAERPEIKVITMSRAPGEAYRLLSMNCPSFKSRSQPRPCGIPSGRCSVLPLGALVEVLSARPAIYSGMRGGLPCWHSSAQLVPSTVNPTAFSTFQIENRTPIASSASKMTAGTTPTLVGRARKFGECW